jgi:hypothetical protein
VGHQLEEISTTYGFYFQRIEIFFQINHLALAFLGKSTQNELISNSISKSLIEEQVN